MAPLVTLLSSNDGVHGRTENTFGGRPYTQELFVIRDEYAMQSQEKKKHVFHCSLKNTLWFTPGFFLFGAAWVSDSIGTISLLFFIFIVHVDLGNTNDVTYIRICLTIHGLTLGTKCRFGNFELSVVVYNL